MIWSLSDKSDASLKLDNAALFVVDPHSEILAVHIYILP